MLRRCIICHCANLTFRIYNCQGPFLQTKYPVFAAPPCNTVDLQSENRALRGQISGLKAKLQSLQESYEMKLMAKDDKLRERQEWIDFFGRSQAKIASLIPLDVSPLVPPSSLVPTESLPFALVPPPKILASESSSLTSFALVPPPPKKRRMVLGKEELGTDFVIE